MKLYGKTDLQQAGENDELMDKLDKQIDEIDELKRTLSDPYEQNIIWH